MKPAGFCVGAWVQMRPYGPINEILTGGSHHCIKLIERDVLWVHVILTPHLGCYAYFCNLVKRFCRNRVESIKDDMANMRSALWMGQFHLEVSLRDKNKVIAGL